LRSSTGAASPNQPLEEARWPQQLSEELPRREPRRATVLGVAAAAGLGLALFTSSPRKAFADDLEDLIGAEESSESKPKNKAIVRVRGPAHDQAETAASVLHDLQTNWGSIEKQGAAGAEKLLEELGSNVGRVLKIKVPSGSVGIDVEDRTVVAVNRGELGWVQGDVILDVSGTPVENQSDLMQKVQDVKSKGGQLVFSVERKTASPFVTLEAALQKIYSDADSSIPLAEPAEVQKLIRQLRINAQYVKDGVFELGEIRKDLDAILVELDKFVAA